MREEKQIADEVAKLTTEIEEFSYTNAPSIEVLREKIIKRKTLVWVLNENLPTKK